ncbi:MAG: ABC transporter ATP-binding protein [Candidatus Competibacteraceae bacterium]|jgi:branched-chain amino acid transport system ATP-binding protein|nr:ABC transporter ATP-binding protein [Candidatus Competibacteraceae bacterium]
MLDVRGLSTGYGVSQVLFGVDLTVAEGEVVTLLGRNGMGKTTVLRAIMGLTRAWTGTVHFQSKAIQQLPGYAIARAGVGLVPEGRQIFPTLTVEENLLVTAADRGVSHTPPWTLERVYALFPKLAERDRQRGDQLSGGEQQMLAIARALMTNPRLLILDEATEGLAPLIREEIWQVLEALKHGGESILIVDKHLQALLRIADRHYIMEKGRVVWSGDSVQLAGNSQVQEHYLGI